MNVLVRPLLQRLQWTSRDVPKALRSRKAANVRMKYACEDENVTNEQVLAERLATLRS